MSKSVYLASQSPRRLELLRQIGLTPVVLPLRHAQPRADVDETPLAGERAPEYVRRLAGMKVEAGMRALVGRRLPAMPVIAADTTVTLDGLILGKPESDAEAADMLRRYSGRTHSVLTAVGVAYLDHVGIAVSESEVTFKALSEAEIAAYVASREPYDKAGGYGIQGRAALFVAHISGSYSGIMGLPVHETGELLRSLAFEVL
ncbi:MAG: septum formation inhibitor Maf [Thiobacillus sp.]|nr:septum formation inhibitor Maf [Thiobacillus sp.]